jgi:uncharacterized membrane protein YphA (DoxX/SURF4 family)
MSALVSARISDKSVHFTDVNLEKDHAGFLQERCGRQTGRAPGRRSPDPVSRGGQVVTHGDTGFHGLPGFIASGVLVGEVVAPLLLITGVYARIGGLLIVINMLFAVGLMHMDGLFAISEHGGYQLELQAFFLFGGLAVLLLGSGKFALRPD